MGPQEDMDGSWYQGKQPGLAGSVRYRETLELTGHHGVTGTCLVLRGAEGYGHHGGHWRGTRGSLVPGRNPGLVDIGG